MKFQAKNMEFSNTLNCAVRIKEEPSDVPSIENNCEAIDKKPDLKNVQLLSFSRESSTCTLRKCEENHEIKLNDEVEIVVECEDVKPNTDILAIKKMDDYTPNHLRNLKYSDGCEIKIKIETAEDVKLKCFSDDAQEQNLNIDHEFVDQNKKRRITKKFNNEHNLKINIGTVHTCKTCGKTFKRKFNLDRHVKSTHDGVTYECDTCGKKFTQKESLKIHIDRVHNGVKCACDICGKKFTSKAYLRIHIDSVHNGILHECGECEKKFSDKSRLKKHIDVMHNGVAHTCDICRKKFSTKSNLKQHIDSVHLGTTHACDLCEKKFTQKSFLKPTSI